MRKRIRPDKTINQQNYFPKGHPGVNNQAANLTKLVVFVTYTFTSSREHSERGQCLEKIYF
jgi:hypothetical protein